MDLKTEYQDSRLKRLELFDIIYDESEDALYLLDQGGELVSLALPTIIKIEERNSLRRVGSIFENQTPSDIYERLLEITDKNPKINLIIMSRLFSKAKKIYRNSTYRENSIEDPWNVA